MGYNLLINWGYNPLINLLFTSWDIQVSKVLFHHHFPTLFEHKEIFAILGMNQPNLADRYILAI